MSLCVYFPAIAETNLSEKAIAGSTPLETAVQTDQLINNTINNEQLLSENINDTNTSKYISTDQLDEPDLYQLFTAEFAVKRGDTQTAINIYKEQSFKKHSTAVFERALSLSLAHEDAEKTLYFANAWKNQHPYHDPAWFYVAHLALKAQEYDIASQTLNHILDEDPRADVSSILQGVYPKDPKDLRKLLNTFQQLDSQYNSSLSVVQAGLLLKFDEADIALMHIERALVEQPDRISFITLKADILKKIAIPQEVLSYLDKERKRLPTEKALYLYEIRYLLDLKQKQRALEVLLSAHKQFPEDPEITLLAGLVSLDNKKYLSADELFGNLLQYVMYQDRANYYLGISAEQQHNYDSATQYFQQVMQENLVLDARKKVISFNILKGNLPTALATAVQLRDQFDIYAPESYALEAKILQAQGQTDEAKELLNRVQVLYPKNETLTFARADLLDSQSDYVAKHALLASLVANHPTNAIYKLHYAKLLLSKYPDSSIGLRLVKEIADIPFNDKFYDSSRHLQALNLLAEHALNNQDYKQVITLLRAPYDVKPTVDSGRLLLSAYQKMNNQQQADDIKNDLRQRFSFRYDDQPPVDSLQNY